MIKKAMVSIDRSIVRRSLKSKMLLQVHDELLFEVPEEELTELRTLVHAGMKDALPLSVPLEVEIGTGDNWVDAH
jgi:DNA polymerase-1